MLDSEKTRATATALAAPALAWPVEVAVVGAGFIADFHLAILKGLADVRVVAVCDVDRGRAAAAAKKHGVPHAVSDLAELPALGVRVAHLSVPPDLHVTLTRRLLDLGIGVFAEKPLALAAADARTLADRAAAAGLPLAVNHNNVFHPAFRRLVQRVESGAIGRVQHVQVTLSVPLRQLDAGDFTHWMFREPKNIVFEQATHPVSQIHRLLGRLVRAEATVLSRRELNPGQVFCERWVVAAEAERGTAELYLAFGPPFTRSTFAVLGTDGSVEADLFHDAVAAEEKTLYLDFWNSFLASWRRGRDLKRDARKSLFGWLGATLGLHGRRDVFYVGMRDSIREFYSALRRGAPYSGGAAAAVEVAEWCDAIAAAAPAAPPAPRPLPAPGPARAGEVVVLGGSGFIGRRVVTKLLDRGVPVTVVTRRAAGLPPEVAIPAASGRVRIVRASLENPGDLAAACAGARAVVHLATGGGETYEAVERAMVQGTLKVAEAVADAKVARLVYVSSIAALYLGADGPALVDDALATDPEPLQRPPYARGKIAAERALQDFHARRPIGLVIARPGVVLGQGTPMQHSGLGMWARDNHCVGWGLGATRLPVVWVDDVAEALVRAALHAGAELDGQAFNLCADVPLTARELVNELARATGRPLRFHPRSLGLSQTMEIGKWLVKKAGRRKGAAFPSYRDLKSRALAPRFRCRIAREVLGWRPVEGREEFLDCAIRIYGDAAPPR